MQQNKDFLFPVSAEGPYALSDFLQKHFFEEFNGKIDVLTPQAHGMIFIQNGNPIHASFDKKEGDEALLELLQLPNPNLTAVSGIPSPASTIGNKLENLLIEFALREQNITGKNVLSPSKSDPTSSKSSSLLEVHNPPAGKFEFPLDHTEVSIGRVDSNILPLPNISLSSHHALIFLQGGAYHLKDLNSSNGTFLNGKRIKESVLKNGDQIQLGDVRIQFHSRLKRPQIQPVLKSQLKQPLAKKNSQTPAVRITDALRLESSPGDPQSLNPDQKNRLFFIITLIVLVLGGLGYYLFHK
ncbi:MAG: FHA domain-containing protein [Verrucomicrobiota bacterium]